MSTKAQRDSSKERYWRQRVQQWRRSGLSVRAFCAQHGLSEPSFYGWRRTLQQRQTAAKPFVPVQVIPDRPAAAAAQGAADGLELVLAGGRVLRIGPGFDAATLRRLLAVLAEERSSW